MELSEWAGEDGERVEETEIKLEKMAELGQQALVVKPDWFGRWIKRSRYILWVWATKVERS